MRVWDVIEKTQVAEFHGHKFGVNCVVSTLLSTEARVLKQNLRHD